MKGLKKRTKAKELPISIIKDFFTITKKSTVIDRKMVISNNRMLIYSLHKILEREPLINDFDKVTTNRTWDKDGFVDYTLYFQNKRIGLVKVRMDIPERIMKVALTDHNLNNWNDE